MKIEVLLISLYKGKNIFSTKKNILLNFSLGILINSEISLALLTTKFHLYSSLQNVTLDLMLNRMWQIAQEFTIIGY